MNIEIKEVASEPWEETIDYLTADMPAEEIDICLLAERYKQYIDEMQEYDLKVPANAVRVCSALLNLKTQAVIYGETLEEENEEEFLDDPELEMEEDIEDEGRQPDLEEGPPLNMPVKQKPKRRIHINELKDSLRDALEVKERREERQEMRQEMDQQFEMDEETLEDKLNNLLGSIKNLISRETKEKVEFDNLVENNDNQEKIEKFKHILHLENDEKVQLIQKEFLGELKVKPEEVETKT